MRTIVHTNIYVLPYIGADAGERRKKKSVKSSSLPNTFDDDYGLFKLISWENFGWIFCFQEGNGQEEIKNEGIDGLINSV